METLTTESQLISKRKLNTDEYHLMAEVGIIRSDERVELIKGEIVEMSPVGDKHLSIVSRIHTLLTPALVGKYIVHVQSPVKIADHSEPEPDLMVVPHRDDFYAESGVRSEDVLLLIEVSDTTLQKDQHIKLPLYAEAGIPEVWIVDVSSGKIYQYLNPQHHEYLERKTFDRSMKLSASQFSLEADVKALIG
jgi:Uma2 family endonuclease